MTQNPPPVPPFGHMPGHTPPPPEARPAGSQPTNTPPSVPNGSATTDGGSSDTTSGSPPPSRSTGLLGRGPNGVVRTVLSWILILAIAIGWVWSSQERHAKDEKPVENESVSMLSEMSGRIMHSVAKLVSDLGQPGAFNEVSLRDAAPPPGAPWIDRVAYAILKADLLSPEKGLEELTQVGVPSTASDGDRALFEDVRTSLTEWGDGRPRPPLQEPEAKRLGWYAKLMSGDVPQSNLAVIVMLFGIWFAGMILIGVILLITSGILALVGSMRSSMALTGRGAVYAETFAVWFTLFVGLQLGFPRLLVLAGLPELIIPGAVMAMFSSLSALAWPVLRGVSWSDVRRDVGLHTGKGLIREVLVGPLVYAAGLPLMATGLIIYSIARSLSPETQQATHPIVEQFAGGGWNVLVIYLLACVAAPIVEEIAFRGILYRHLRESGRWIGGVGSAVVATLVSSVLFAGIHPQGLLFIPVLGGLATAFCFGREWRGSLVPCMVAHAMNNAVTITLGVTLANG